MSRKHEIKEELKVYEENEKAKKRGYKIVDRLDYRDHVTSVKELACNLLLWGIVLGLMIGLLIIRGLPYG